MREFFVLLHGKNYFISRITGSLQIKTTLTEVPHSKKKASLFRESVTFK